MRPRPILVGHAPDGAPIYLTPDQRSTGVHIVGAPGSGKSKAMEAMIRQDLRYGAGGLFLDPHGEGFRAILTYCARNRFHRRIYVLNVSDGQMVCGFNPFAPRPGGDPATRVLRCVTSVLKAWGIQNPDEAPRMLRWLKNVFTIAIERGDITVNELALLLRPENEAVRAYLSANTSVESEWRQLDQLKRVSEFDEQIQSTKNRLDVLTCSTTTRRFLSLIDPSATLDLGRAIEEGAFILVNLQPSPTLDPRNARLIGTMLLSELFDAIRQRRLPRRGTPRPFAVYVDEAQNFITHDIPELFAQGRKFGLFLTIAHQFLDQMRHEDERILAALDGAARTKIVFAVGSDRDAKDLVHEVFPGQIDYTETKQTQWQTKFRPIDTRDKTFTRSKGGARGQSEGGNTSTTTGEIHTEGRTVGQTEGYESGHSVMRGRGNSRGRTEGETLGEADTDSTGHATTNSQARGVAQTTGHTSTDSIGTTRTAMSTHLGSSSRQTTPGLNPGDLPQTTTTESDVYSSSTSTTTSDTHVESDTESVTHSVVDGYAETESEGHAHTKSRAVSRSQSETVSETDAETDSESRSRADSLTDTESDAETRSETDGKTWAETDTETWAESESDAPVTRHKEFREGTVESFTLEEQRQRRADQLRLLPQRTCIVRTPDGNAVQVRVPTVEPVNLSLRRVAAYEEELAKRTGAMPAAEVDAIIENRRLEIEDKARTFAASGARALQFENDHDAHDEPIFHPRLKPRRKKNSS